MSLGGVKGLGSGKRLRSLNETTRRDPSGCSDASRRGTHFRRGPRFPTETATRKQVVALPQAEEWRRERASGLRFRRLGRTGAQAAVRARQRQPREG